MSNLIYNDKTIMGSNTSFEIDLDGKEKLIYNYEIKKRVLNIYIYNDNYLISEDDKYVLKSSYDIIKINNKKYIKLSKSELNSLKNNIDIEIKYIKLE